MKLHLNFHCLTQMFNLPQSSKAITILCAAFNGGKMIKAARHVKQNFIFILEKKLTSNLEIYYFYHRLAANFSRRYFVLK